MKKEDIKYFENKLLKNKRDVNSILNQMRKNQVIDSNMEMSTELSFYDNHPSDSASELCNKEQGIALKENEISILNQIDTALKNIENGTYGICKMCGDNIGKERLDFIPYTEYCVKCKNNMYETETFNIPSRPIEEKVLRYSSAYSSKDYRDRAGFDGEDSYQCLEKFNRLKNIYEYDDNDDEYVEAVEKISNEQFKQQLPD